MDFRSVQTIEEATSILGQYGNDARLVAGGTDVMIQFHRGDITPKLLLNIAPIKGADGIAQGEATTIGALTSHRKIATSPHLRAFPSVMTAASLVGGWQTQSAGTLGGNICNASPAADTIPPLLIHNALVLLYDSSGTERRVPLAEFLIGRRETARHPDELLVQVELETPSAMASDMYYKVGRRSAMEIAIVGLATMIEMDVDGETIKDVRIAVCSVAPKSYRVDAVEVLLTGNKLSQELLDEAGDLLVRSASPIDDIRGSERYRKAVLPRVLNHSLTQCAENARRRIIGGV